MQFGLLAICWGRVGYSLIAFYLNTYYTKRLLNYGFWTQIKEIIPFLLMSLGIGGLGWLIARFVTTAWLSLVIAILACVFSYIALCKVFRVESFEHLLTLSKQYLHSSSTENE